MTLAFCLKARETDNEASTHSFLRFQFHSRNYSSKTNLGSYSCLKYAVKHKHILENGSALLQQRHLSLHLLLHALDTVDLIPAPHNSSRNVCTRKKAGLEKDPLKCSRNIMLNIHILLSRVLHYLDTQLESCSSLLQRVAGTIWLVRSTASRLSSQHALSLGKS